MRDFFISAVLSVLENRLRSILTISIIAVGIMALVGIETSIDILADGVAGSFGKMGVGLYSIEGKDKCRPLSYNEAYLFKSQFRDGVVSIESVLSDILQVSHGSISTDPVTTLIAVDENYRDCQMAEMASGRFFSRYDMENPSHIAVLGDNVRAKLFPAKTAEGEYIMIGGEKYYVIGCFSRQGAVFGTGLDNSVAVPITSHVTSSDDVALSVRTFTTGDDCSESVSSAKSLMRSIRRLRPTDETDFEMIKSDSVQSNFMTVKSKLSAAALGIGLITLFGAAVGLMNILLVSVKERTREIGIRKALGAKESTIQRQFLGEAVMIGQIGCLAGTVLGVMAGNIVALVMDGGFTLPVKWMAVAVILAIAVSLLSGSVPAKRAASLNPVEALTRL